MRRKLFILLLVIITGSFFIFSKTTSLSSDIIINEIGATEPSGQEWVEIFNRGMSPIDLTGWKFFDTTMGTTTVNHSLKVASTTDSIIAPGEYGVITQDASKIFSLYLWVTSSVFEASWLALNESGEEVGLVDNTGTKVEDFTYVAAKNNSLERKDVFLNDYTSLNWLEHPVSNTIGRINWATIMPTSTPTSTSSSVWSQIKINEVMPDPDVGDEWVEFYNPTTSSLDLTGGTLCDNRMGTCLIAAPTSTIGARSWLQIFASGNHLNNTGDSVILKSPDGTVIDQMMYSGSLVPKNDQTVVRKSDGVDTDNDSADWAVTVQPTPGATNVISNPPVSNPPGGGGSSNPPPVSNPSSIPPSPNLPKIPTLSTNPVSAIFLNEILPNPTGADTADEFIELRNQTAQEVSVQDWKLVVGTKMFQLTGSVLPNQFLVLPVTLTKISLKNAGGDEVLLYSPGDILTDRVVYGSAPSGKSFSRGNDGMWSWTKTITKGSSNVIVSEEEKSSEADNKNSDIVWKTSFPKTAEVGKEVILSVEGTKDKNSGTINLTWSFSDTTNTWSGGEIKRMFNDEGKVTGTVTASSTNGSSKKTFTITVNPAEIHDTGEIKISEVLVNPEGADKDEFIELYNPFDRTVSLNGWEIRTKNGKKFIIEDTEISSDEYLVFKQSETKLSLNNTDETVILFDADEKSIDSVRITKSPEGESYGLLGSKWDFTEPTPGKANKKDSKIIDGDTPEGGTKTTSKSSSKTSSGTKALGGYEMASIAEVRPMLKGAHVIVQGVVVSKPGAVGAKTFYIMDEERGIAVYAGKKDLPNIKIGDQVEVQATVSSAYGAPRLNAQAIVIMDSGEHVEPESVEDEVDETMAGHLVTLQGEITKSQATSVYLDSDFGEVLVAIRKSAGLKKADFVVGDQVEITGIVEQTKDNEWQVVPREKDDVNILEKTAKSVAEESKKSDDKIEEDKNKTSGSSTMPYVEMGASGVVGALLVRILGGGRGMLVFGGLKKLFVKKEEEDNLV